VTVAVAAGAALIAIGAIAAGGVLLHPSAATTETRHVKRIVGFMASTAHVDARSICDR
jgi:hypothetical protein